MKKVKVRFGIRTEKSLKQSFSVDVMRQFYLHSAIICFLIGFALLFFSEEYYRISDEVGYVTASVWWLASVVLFAFSIPRNRQKKKTRSIGMPVDIDGNIIRDKTLMVSPHKHTPVLTRNRIKFITILLILLGFYYSMIVLQFHEHEESKIFIYGFPVMILIITFIAAIVVVPGLKTNIRILVELGYILLLCILSPIAYYIYSSNRVWHVVFIICCTAIVLAFASLDMYKNYVYKKEDKKLPIVESTENEQTA